MKTCSSLVEMISDGEKIVCKINATSGWSIYRNVLPNHQNANLGSSAIDQWTEIYLHGLDIIGMKIQDWLWKCILI